MATYQFKNIAGLSFPDYEIVDQAVTISGLSGRVQGVSITLKGLSHQWTPDLDFLLVSPREAVGYEFWSDIGTESTIVNRIDVTVTDVAGAPLPDDYFGGGWYRPADRPLGSTGTETWPGYATSVKSAAPTGSETFASAFGGLDPNGEWRLFASDDEPAGIGSLYSWTLTIVTNEARALTDVLASVSVNEGDPAALLDGDITFNVDVDEFENGKLVVSGLLAEDTVSIRDVGAGTGEIGFAGGIVSYEGVGIGTATGGSGTDLVVTFDRDAKAKAIEALVENLTYLNGSNSPTAQRTIQVTVTDAFGGETSIWRPDYANSSPNPQVLVLSVDFGRAAFGDIDGDGDTDSVLGQSIGPLALALQNADGGFEGQSGSNDPFQALGTFQNAKPAVGDIDADGDLDLVVASGAGSVVLFLQDDAGNFAAASVNPFSAINLGSSGACALDDIDRDGDLDLVTTDPTNGLLLYLQGSTGTFTAATQEQNPFDQIAAANVAGLSLGDLDGDGDSDLVLGSFDGFLRLFFQDKDGDFVEASGGDNPFDGVDYGSQVAPAIADIDGDGYADLALGIQFASDRFGIGYYKAEPSFGITVNVTAVNDAPTLTGDLEATVAEGGSVVLTSADLGFDDPDDEAAGVFFTVSSLVNGTIEVDGVAASEFTAVQLGDGLVVFRHDGSQTTSASFQVTVEDGDEDASTPAAETFALTVTPVDQPPSAPSDIDGQAGGSVAEDAAIGAAVGITAKAIDPDSPLTYRLTDDAGGLFAIDEETGVVTVAKALDFETSSSYSITVVATGSGVDGPASEFTIDVTDVNEAPTNLVVTPTVAVPENVPIAAATLLAAFSYDDDALGTEARVLSGPDAALFSGAGNGIFWADGLTPDFEDQDEYRFTLTLADEDGLSTAAEVVVDVENRAVTNVVVAALGSIREDAVPDTVAARFTAFENGTAEPQAAFTLVDDAGGRFYLAGNELRLTKFGELDFEAHASHTVTIRAGDGTGEAVEKSFVIQVVDVDESGPVLPEPTDGPDEIPGTPGPDDLAGLDGDDTFLGSDGDDTISGGDGLDRVVYAGSREDFRQDLLPDGTILVTKPDGSTDRLSGIERMEFEDGAFVFDLDGDAAPFAYLLYQAAYDRVPDEAGLRFWTGVLDQLDDELGPDGAALAVAAYFLDADEFEENYGTDPSDEDFVEALYDNALGRAPDGAGADFWEEALAGGLSREAALVAFAMSAENLAGNAPNIEDGFWVG